MTRIRAASRFAGEAVEELVEDAGLGRLRDRVDRNLRRLRHLDDLLQGEAAVVVVAVGEDDDGLALLDRLEAA